MVQTRRALLGAWKGGICGTVWSLPHLAKFIEDVRDLGLVGLVVHEDDDAFPGKDHVTESGPVAAMHRNPWGNIEVVGETRILNGIDIVGDIAEVRVDEEDCNDVVRMFLDPRGHC